MLFLIGFMAAGKTSVGRALAARTGRGFVDLDDEIAATAGEPVAALVARDEPAFRRAETAALAAVIAATAGDVIVATGGGAPMFGDNLARMRAAGVVIALGVDVADAKLRAGGGAARPLLARADELAAARAATYRRAHAVVDTGGKSIDTVAGEVAAVEAAVREIPEPARDRAVVVALAERSYPIAVADTLAELAPMLRRELVARRASRVAVITDRNVAPHWMAAAHAALADAGIAVTATHAIAPGEASKSFAEYARLSEALIADGLDRSSAIIALGGGVVGDLAGFVAATLFRGIAVIHLPTTLVAMTDSAIGGKTAVDVPAGKNLVGAFHQPRLVGCALATLATLPVRERRAGFGELWKYALLDGEDLWSAVDACAPWAAASELQVIGEAGPPPELAAVIARAISYKAAIVGRDERERTGVRALLNLGHTIGHAIESQADGALLHGEAVGLGLVAACRVSAALGAPDLQPRVVAALARTGLPWDLDRYLDAPTLARVRVDKKRQGATLRFIAVRGVGRCDVADVAIADLQRILLPDAPA